MPLSGTVDERWTSTRTRFQCSQAMLVETGNQATHALAGCTTCGQGGLRERQALVDGEQRFCPCDHDSRCLMGSCELFQAQLLVIRERS